MSYQANVALAEGKSLKVYIVIIVVGGSTGNDVYVTKSWFCLSCQQTRTLRDQQETILDLQMELALAYNQIVKLKAEKSSSIKCNSSSKQWTVVKAISQRRNKSTYKLILGIYTPLPSPDTTTH
jgi:hypothetical protein